MLLTSACHGARHTEQKYANVIVVCVSRHGDVLATVLVLSKLKAKAVATTPYGWDTEYVVLVLLPPIVFMYWYV